MAVVLPILTEFNDRGVKSAQESLKSLAKTYATTALASGALARGLAKVVQDASDLNESVSKSGVIFGESADQIQAFAKTAADSFGQSSKQALDAASTFATFGKAAGLSGGELVDFSTSLTTLSSDFASFFNTSPEDAITAIGAALRGESEPIRRYGVLLDDATLKQRAMAMGIYDGEGALSAQQKTLAAYSEILAQSTDAQGDFERTQDGLANKTRTLQANIADLSATIGQKLLPTVNDYVSAAVKIGDELQDTGEQSDSLVGKLAKFTLALPIGPLAELQRAVKTVNGLVREYADEVEHARTETEKWADRMIEIERGDLRSQRQASAAQRRKDYAEQQAQEKGAEETAKRRAEAEKERARQAKRAREEAARAAQRERQALKDLAATMNAELRDAQDAALQRLASINQEFLSFQMSFADQVSGYVSLGDAVRATSENEQELKDALKERTKAYEELNAVSKNQWGVPADARAYSDALERVAEAENRVKEAQAKPMNYAQAFGRQVSDALEFAGNLQKLATAGLGPAGIQQLMAIGPMAGNQVAKELLAGTGQMTVQSLNAQLDLLQSAGQILGFNVGQPMFGPQQAAAANEANMFGAASARVQNNNVVINVQGGDPQAVVDALVRYTRQNGALPPTVRLAS